MLNRAERARGLVLVGLCWLAAACVTAPPSVEEARRMLATEGLAQWTTEDKALRQAQQASGDRYRRTESLDALLAFDRETKTYLDHGFLLYHAYNRLDKAVPPDLLQSLNLRTDLFMDVADAYIRQGSTAMATGIARDLIHNYSDLPIMAPAQRRAEALLLR